jgi:hypothetical protein
MNRRRRFLLPTIGIALVGLIIWQFVFRQRGPESELPYLETFDRPGDWIVGESVTSDGRIVDGHYRMYLELSGESFWTTSGNDFSDGIYEVEAQPIEGIEDNGYGMLLRVDAKKERFYFLKVSSDGYVYIGLCQDSCAEVDALSGGDWFPSPAVRQGFAVTNALRVEAIGPEMKFYVNDQLVGQVSDDTLQHGDIGLLAETFAPGGLTVAFDNFRVDSAE